LSNVSLLLNNHFSFSVSFHAKRLRKKQGALLALASSTYDFAATAGKPIKCNAMVARGPKQPLTLEEITVDPPKAGEVRVRVMANALCHTDIYTLGKNHLIFKWFIHTSHVLFA
jgi:hypothetical protein